MKGRENQSKTQLHQKKEWCSDKITEYKNNLNMEDEKLYERSAKKQI